MISDGARMFILWIRLIIIIIIILIILSFLSLLEFVVLIYPNMDKDSSPNEWDLD